MENPANNYDWITRNHSSPIITKIADFTVGFFGWNDFTICSYGISLHGSIMHRDTRDYLNIHKELVIQFLLEHFSVSTIHELATVINDNPLFPIIRNSNHLTDFNNINDYLTLDRNLFFIKCSYADFAEQVICNDLVFFINKLVASEFEIALKDGLFPEVSEQRLRRKYIFYLQSKYSNQLSDEGLNFLEEYQNQFSNA